MDTDKTCACMCKPCLKTWLQYKKFTVLDNGILVACRHTKSHSLPPLRHFSHVLPMLSEPLHIYDILYSCMVKLTILIWRCCNWSPMRSYFESLNVHIFFYCSLWSHIKGLWDCKLIQYSKYNRAIIDITRMKVNLGTWVTWIQRIRVS